jgi:hypothetical protein
MAKALMSLRVDQNLIEKVKQVFGAKSKTRAIEMALEAVLEMDKHRQLIRRFSGRGKPDDFVDS